MHSVSPMVEDTKLKSLILNSCSKRTLLPDVRSFGMAKAVGEVEVGETEVEVGGEKMMDLIQKGRAIYTAGVAIKSSKVVTPRVEAPACMGVGS